MDAKLSDILLPCDDQALIDEENRANEELMCRLREEEKAFHEVWKNTYSAPMTQNESGPEAVLSTEERIELLVEQIFAPLEIIPGAREEVDQWAADAADGLRTTSNVMQSVSDSVKTGEALKDFIGSASKWFGKLSSLFSAGKAIYGIFKFIKGIGVPSEFERIMAQLQEINQQLRKIESTIHQGFADLMEYLDKASFRTEVQIPTQTLFDKYRDCFVVSGETPIKNLKQLCEGNASPSNVLSALYTYLDQNSGIFNTQLKANKYAYSTFKSWMDIVLHEAVRLISVNVFYYGILTEECETAKAKAEMEQTVKDIMRVHISELVRMTERLNEIELERLRRFHSTGHGKEWIKQVFDTIKPKSIDHLPPFSPEFLPKLAYEFREKWRNFNGSHDFYVMISRGRVPSPGENSFYLRHAGFYIGDNERVTVYPNIAFEFDDTTLFMDGLCIALIQPLPEEIREANRLSKDISDKLFNIISDARKEKYPIAATKDKICQLKKPLLIMYNGDTIFGRDHPKNVVASEQAYKTVGEAWSAPGGPFPVKHEWHKNTSGARFFTSACRILQVIFQ